MNNIHNFLDIESIWPEDVQPISKAEMFQALHMTWSNLSMKRDIYVIAIYNSCRNQADGWDLLDYGETKDDIQSLDRYTTIVYYLQAGKIRYKEASFYADPIYLETHNIGITIRGRSAHVIANIVSGMSITTEEIRLFYEKLGII